MSTTPRSRRHTVFGLAVLAGLVLGALLGFIAKQAEVSWLATTLSRIGEVFVSLVQFTVIPLVVYRVYPDGRPDEMIRGVDIVGTPLASFAKITATSNKSEVFNGICGAESGSVPVSAISPALLVSEIEVQSKERSQDRPPFLGRPTEAVWQ